MTTAPVLFRNVMIFDGSGEGLFPGEVMIDGERIAAVGRRGHAIAPNGATVIDGGGNTLLPGLIEPHAHLRRHEFQVLGEHQLYTGAVRPPRTRITRTSLAVRSWAGRCTP